MVNIPNSAASGRWNNESVEAVSPSVVIGKLVRVGSSGELFVTMPGSGAGEEVQCSSAADLREGHLGREVALVFERGDRSLPFIVGLVESRTSSPGKNELRVADSVPRNDKPRPAKPVDIELDGERLVFSAKKEIVLRCGKASITLTRTGKILIRGAYLLNRSSGVNRIKGGTVEIN